MSANKYEGTSRHFTRYVILQQRPGDRRGAKARGWYLPRFPDIFVIRIKFADPTRINVVYQCRIVCVSGHYKFVECLKIVGPG